MSSPAAAPSVVLLAFADEIAGDPGLLEEYASAVGGDDPVTLVVYAPDAEPEALERQLAPLAAACGLDGDGSADVVGLAVPGDPDTRATVVDRVDYLFTARPAPAGFGGLRVVGPGEVAAISFPAAGFTCNVCGAHSPVAHEDLDREVPSCDTCGSTPRFRSVVHALSLGLFGESLPLTTFPERPDLTGVGLSDWHGYAIPLAERLGYRNTYLHTAPVLDITEPDPALTGTLDFVIASEVFEHVPPPVSRAFAGVRRLLRPGGVLVLTVPFVEQGVTKEHFPDLHDWTVVERDGRRVLVNTTADGRSQEFDALCFHGGDGLTLEMRLFALDSLLGDLRAAGFEEVDVLRDPVPGFGICQSPHGSWPVLARVPAAGPGRMLDGWRGSATIAGPDLSLPERAHPGMAHASVMREHALRYAFALDLVAGKDALDLGCGTGYGSEMLTWSARSVTGFDLWQPGDGERPEWGGGARLVYGHDLCRDSLPAADVAVMYEVLEHLPDAPAALRRLWRAVRAAAVSFPNPAFHGSHHNPYHVNDWPLDRVEAELAAAAEGRFASVDFEHFHQAADGLIRPGRDPSASYWLVIARGVGDTPVREVSTRHLDDLRASFAARTRGPEVIVCHIPKTAGTSFRGALAAAYGEDEVVHDQSDRVADPTSRFTTDFEAWCADLDAELALPFPWPRVVTGHFWLGKFARAFPGATRVVWLREPAARILSWFHFWRSLPVAEGNPVHRAVHDGTLDALEFASLDIVRDQMTRIFLRSYTLDDVHFAGVVEHYDDDLERLGALLGWPHVDAMHVNRTSAPGYDRKPDPGLVASIRELNPADVALYEDALHRRERR